MAANYFADSQWSNSNCINKYNLKNKELFLKQINPCFCSCGAGAVSGAHGAVGLGRRLRWSHCTSASGRCIPQSFGAPIQLWHLRFMALALAIHGWLWCGASALSPLGAGLSISSTADAMRCLIAPQRPILLKSIFQLVSFFLAATTACTCLVLKEPRCCCCCCCCCCFFVFF